MQAAKTDYPPPPSLSPRAALAPGEKRPKVTVVMPTYRRPGFVESTMASILAQTFRDFELLVRDDGPGDDGTKEAVLRAAGGDERVRYHHNPKNLRMPSNLNGGIMESRGDFIAVAHDHDLFHPEWLGAMVQLLDRHPSALFAHCGIDIVDQDGSSTGVRHIGPWPDFLSGTEWLDIMLERFGCPVCALTLVRREVHERWGLYDPAYGFIADVEMWMRLSEHGDVAFAARPLVRVRTREVEHDANVNPWPILATSFAIHRRYVPRRYPGIEGMVRRGWMEARADIAVFRELFSRFRHGRGSEFGAAIEMLVQNGGPITRRIVPILQKSGLMMEGRP